jgi:hypothetical protein
VYGCINGYNTQINQAKEAIFIHLAGWHGCTRNVVGVGSNFTPLGDGETNVLALKEFERTVSQDYRTRPIRNFPEQVNLIIARTERYSASLISNFHFRETHARTIHALLIDHDIDSAHKSTETRTRTR